MRLRWLTTAALLAVCAAAALPAAAQQVRVAATVSPSAARVGDVVVLDVSILTAGPAPDGIDVPALPSGLRVTGSNDYTEYEFSMPGGRRRTTRRELTISTVSAGHYIIPPIAVRVDGATYRTRPVRLDVAPGFAAGPPGESAGSADDEVLLQSWATPDTVYVGQQVTVRSDALFSTDVRSRLAGAPQYEAPSAPGFWVYDLPGKDPAQYRPVRGRLYEVQTFRRAFFPLNAGTLWVPGAHLTYAVRRGFLSGPENYDLRSDSFRVIVRSLPLVGRPPAFAGAVGRYTASAHVEPSSVATGEAATLTVEVAGDGNIKALPPPHLPSLTGVQIFSPAEDSDVRPDDETVGGTKRFTWVLVPSRPGQLVIPALELPYFDPTQRRYSVARTEPQAVGVIAGSDQNNPVTGALTVAALRPLRERDDGAGVAPFVHSPAFPALVATPVLALLGLLLGRRRRRARPEVRARGGSVMLERLSGALAALRARAGASDAQAPATAERAASVSAGEVPVEVLEGSRAGDTIAEDLLHFMREWLAERLGAPELAETAPTRLDGALRAAGVRATVASSIGTLAARLEQVRFTPEPPAPPTLVAWVDEAERLLSEVHVGVRTKRRRGIAGPAAIVAVALAGGGAGAGALHAAVPPQGDLVGGPPAATDSAFAAGLAAYRAGHFSEAAEQFEAYAARNATHAVAWYDLGNAAFRAGDRGRAIWGWLRALELRPRDGDVRQNLALAGADPGLVDAVTPAVAASVDELLLAAGLIWLLGAGTLVARRVWTRRWLSIVGGSAVTMSIALVLLVVSAYMGRPAGIMTDPSALRGGPNMHADSVGELKEGSAIRILERRDAWARVRDAAGEGQDGWVETARIGAL